MKIKYVCIVSGIVMRVMCSGFLRIIFFWKENRSISVRRRLVIEMVFSFGRNWCLNYIGFLVFRMCFFEM